MTAAAEPEGRILTRAPHGHILTNTDCWSPDSRWVIYDVRPDPAGSVFEGKRIERVDVETGNVDVLFESKNDAHCGVVTASPVDDRIVFIHGPEKPTEDWQYAGHHRRGVLVNAAKPGIATNLDARNIVAPFTPGALRGGTHVHVFDGEGQWVSFTYQDHVLHALDPVLDLRNVGISLPGCPVSVPETHPRNHHGSHFSILVSRTTQEAKPGSDEINRAYSDAWVGRTGYPTESGHTQKAIAFLGDLLTEKHEKLTELFIVDLPGSLTRHEPDPALAGTADSPPQPPPGIVQRRLTRTADRSFPGIQGVRHWPRSSPDGSSIAFLMKDDNGVSQFWTISPLGGQPRQLTHLTKPVASAFSWSPDGRSLAAVVDGAVCVIDADSGKLTRRTLTQDPPPRPEACVFSPDGQYIAYLIDVDGFNQVAICASQ
ncbi:MAG: DUF3748 domain-containing protein [Verrucomicrobiota bacterium]